MIFFMHGQFKGVAEESNFDHLGQWRQAAIEVSVFNLWIFRKVKACE
jgi:hypothetical protein